MAGITLDSYLEGELPEIREYGARFHDLGRKVAAAGPEKRESYEAMLESIWIYLARGFYAGSAIDLSVMEEGIAKFRVALELKEKIKFLDETSPTMMIALHYIFTTFGEPERLQKMGKLYGAYLIGSGGDIGRHVRDAQRWDLASGARWN
ncbi:MAG: hypothetical protein AABX32_06520 [Nanoarchaeota archaeon]